MKGLGELSIVVKLKVFLAPSCFGQALKNSSRYVKIIGNLRAGETLHEAKGNSYYNVVYSFDRTITGRQRLHRE
jgi:hypothetical protein